MSTLNQAFIKAYQRRGVGGPHLPLGPPKREATEGRRDRETERQREGETEGSKVPDVAPLADRLSDAPSLLPSISPSLLPAGPNAQAISPRPADTLRPAFEVERFDWPGVVTSLLDQSREQVASLLDELLPLGHGTLLVSGCRRGEGRTSVALMLARHAAQSGGRVVLVDADIHRPQLATSLSTVAEVGWEETLSEKIPLGEALIESLDDRLTILPLRRPVAESVLAAHVDRMTELIERLQAQFDVVCIDTGPLAESGEGCHEALFGRTQIEAAVAVRDVRNCRLEQTHAVGRKLVQLGVSRWAIIENFWGVGVPPA